MKTSPRTQFSLKEKKQRNKTKCEIFLGEQNVRFENPLGPQNRVSGQKIEKGKTSKCQNLGKVFRQSDVRASST